MVEELAADVVADSPSPRPSPKSRRPSASPRSWSSSDRQWLSLDCAKHNHRLHYLQFVHTVRPRSPPSTCRIDSPELYSSAQPIGSAPPGVDPSLTKKKRSEKGQSTG